MLHLERILLVFDHVLELFVFGSPLYFGTIYGEIVQEVLMIDPNIVSITQAGLGLHEVGKPLQGPEIDSLSDIEAPVEAAVIGSWEHDHELSRLLNHSWVIGGLLLSDPDAWILV